MEPALEIRFVETSVVTDEELSRIANEWVARGWSLEHIHFVTRDSSRRPAMAFLRFSRPAAAEPHEGGP